MSPRTGRPPKDNPRNINLGVRLTKDEAELLQKCADAMNTTRTDAIVAALKKLWESLKK